MRGDEMAQAGGAPSPGGSLRRAIESGPRSTSPPRIGHSAPAYSDGVHRLAQLARLIEQDQTLAAIIRGGQSKERVDLSPLASL